MLSTRKRVGTACVARAGGRTFGRRLLGGLATAWLAGGLGAPAATAQGTLGFTIDPTQGVPGITVTGQVDVADVSASCVTDLAEFQARFTAQFEGPFVSGNTEGDLPQRFFPDPTNTVYETTDQLAYVLTLAALLGISQDINGATANAFAQSFVMTFVDPATLRPVGALGQFDPTTGAGSVVVPAVDPGVWPVVATCVGPIFDVDAIEAAIRQQTAPFLDSIGVQFGPDGIFSPEFEAFMQQYLDTELTGFDLFIAFVSAIGPQLIQPIVTPDALGLQPFTVLAPAPERVAGVITDIEALVDAGQLKSRQAKALIQVLKNALRSLDDERSEAACDQLGAFAAVATAKVTAGALDAAAAEALIADVESIRAQLGCEVASPSGAFLDGGVPGS
jgi:hypothetical protein